MANMQSLLNLLVFLGLLASLVAAAPSQIQKRSFKVPRVKNENFKGHNGPRQLLKAYRKYSMPIPAALLDSIRNGHGSAASEAEDVTVSAVQTKAKGKGRGRKGKGAGNAGNSGSAGNAGNAGNTTTSTNSTAGVGLVTATPETNDVEYLSPVNIGGQTLNLDFDSGSSDLWVFNTQLSNQATAGHTLYDPTKSSTFKLLQGASFSISYGDGSGAAGNVGTDTVSLGGATVTGQAIEMATAVSDSFIQDTANNGLLGLAFSQLNTVKPQQQKTFFDNVIPSLSEPVFTADLRKDAVGAYEFGRIDASKFTGQMTWVPINTTQGFWQFSSTQFAVGTGAAQKGAANGQAIADTGTTLILASTETVNGYYSQVQGAVDDQQVGGVTVPCDANLPDLMLDVGGTMAKVKGSDIVFAPVQGNTCFGGLQATTSSLQIYGDIFFKSQFVAFNGGNNSIGIAEHI